ncbi:6,7-dimethyl-8-ribityllumazine synthase [Candidatus Micrarchaeota archaeon CG1_02_55_22]|nr:MAG: 6,7-dimethyl-8-ribityllumazine synthase [Candidatus Micrarchaeota archaeon CG1_02_55_22]
MVKRKLIGIAVAGFHAGLANSMLAAALDEAKKQGLAVGAVYRVPGAFELPLAAKHLFDNGVDGVVALGVVIKGGTNHDELVAGNAARKLADLSLEYKKPVGLGVIGPGVSKEQARVRAEPSARGAVRAVKVMLGVLSSGLGE